MDYVHYTNSTSSLNGILENGLLINPLKRNLIHLFSNSKHFKEREPQEFGMVSLRIENHEGSIKHINQFGAYGISFKDSWVISKQFKPVIYLRESSRQHIELLNIYKDAEEELIRCIEKRPKDDEFPNMAYTNKNVAGVIGAIKYVNFLNIYEMLEPHANGWQNEIRSIQKDPLYIDGNTEELVNNISQPGWCNMLMTLKFDINDVSHFITTDDLLNNIKSSLPNKYHDKNILCKKFV